MATSPRERGLAPLYFAVLGVLAALIGAFILLTHLYG
jgi:hypothetical protein